MQKDEPLLKDLTWRKIIKDIINEENIETIISSKGKFYIGVDPTADSMHLGHYITIVLTKLMQDTLKINPIFVIGGFTGQIGDPSGKNSERELISTQAIEKNIVAIKKQIIILADNIGIKEYKIINNSDFYENISVIEFYKTFGKNFNLNQMLSKESVKNRRETGISYTEFSYQIFQAIDFYYLNKDHNVQMQIGGSDQWGNIVAGIELIRKIKENTGEKISGLTIELLTDKNGNKIGKTQGKPIWLDINKTSVYEFYQYILNLDDETAINLIKKLTLISQSDFEKLSSKHIDDPKNRLIQNKFAELIITNIHSKAQFERAKEISKILFENKINKLTVIEFESIFSNFKMIKYDKISIIDFVINNSLLKSKREFRDFLNSKAIKINGIVAEDENLILTNDLLLHKLYIVLNIGKKNKYLVKQM